MPSIYIPEKDVDAIRRFTDVGGWSASWHWERDSMGRLTVDGAQRMLDDLHADGDVEDAVLRAVKHVEQETRRRYHLAEMVREKLSVAQAQLIADTHDETCTCATCVKAGYA